MGSSLSTLRRDNVEEGPFHRTLRKLGALFEQVVPSTPKLIKVYSLRTSEISKVPGISPKGTKSDSPFEAFVGADGTSIWAAATSGPAAIGVHLLACMLARQFKDAKESTALWVQVVLERIEEIRLLVEQNHVISATSVVAARQDISREELATFDASVRSWLCSADEAMLSKQKRLMLMISNISVPVNSGSSTYHTVMDAWVQAMTGFESLLGGTSQEVSNGAVLRALSSWHLYPDLIVLVEKTVNVRFKDPLLPQGSVITIELQSCDQKQKDGIKWSLTLSHLRYYGDPVVIESSGSDELVDILQLHLVAFGSLLGAWRLFDKDTVAIASWFRILWDRLRSLPMEPGFSLEDSLPWLKTLVITASLYLNSQGSDRETAQALINYGRRERGQSFLGGRLGCPAPFFGLGSPSLLISLSAENEIECGMKYYRDLAARCKFDEHEILISVRQTQRDVNYVEFATAVARLKTVQRPGNRQAPGQEVRDLIL